MTKVLITGANGYIATHLAVWLERFAPDCAVTLLSLRGDTWKNESFAGYDAVLHLAGLAHIKETEQNKALYNMVNRDLTVQAAQKAKADGVSRFVFLSTMSVYDPRALHIDAATPLTPATAYGKSKLQAERQLEALADDRFQVVVVRPPMVYGPDCPGNFKHLQALALRCPVFPSLKNKRSMIYIDNLCEFLRLSLTVAPGVYCPQNAEYACTAEIYRLLRRAAGRKAVLTGLFNPAVRLLSARVGTLEKVFGDKTCDFSLSAPELHYNVVPFEESIESCLQKQRA